MGTSVLEAAASAMFEFEELDRPRHTRVGWDDATILSKGHYLQRALLCARTFGRLSGDAVLAEAGMTDPNENFLTSNPL